MQEQKQKLTKLLSEKKEMLDQLRELKNRFETEKKLRDEHNKKVKESKEKRACIFDQVNDIRKKLIKFDKEMEGMSQQSETYRDDKEEYDKLSWRYQTDVFSPQTEKKIVKRLDELENILEQGKEFAETKKEHVKLLKELKKLRIEASTYHQLVTTHAMESEKHHKELVAMFEQRERLEKKLSETSKKIDEIKASLGEEYEKTKAEDREDRAVITKEKEEIKQSQRSKMMERAKEVYAKFKRGEKVSLNDLALLDEFDMFKKEDK